MIGCITLVPTPIGNLSDITLRALEVLKAADVIACEDTRHSRILLNHHGIDKPLISLHEHNEASRSMDLVRQISEGVKVAVISDAGSPVISDPGARLMQKCLAMSIEPDILPGPCAIITALMGSGLPAVPYYFGGFLPQKSGQRTRELTAALQRDHTSVFFESPFRIVATVTEIAASEPTRRITVARELTKKFHQFHRGSACVVAEEFSKKPPKGEMVLLIAGTNLPKYMQ